MGTREIEEVSHITHVGTKICAYANNNERISDICRKGYSLLSGLTAIGMKSCYLSPTTCCFLWQRVCLSSMLFSCEVWGHLLKHQISDLEKVQKCVAKRIQGFHWRTHDEIARGMLGMYTMESYIDKKKLMYVHKLATLNGDDMCKSVFMYNSHKYFNGHRVKQSCTQDILNTCDVYGLLCMAADLIIHNMPTTKDCWKILLMTLYVREKISNGNKVY